MKIALTHDYLNQYGGAEKVVEVLCSMFPDSKIFTSIYDSNKMPSSLNKYHIETSFMQKLPFWKKHFRKYLPLYPIAFEKFDLSEYDVVLSSSSAWGKSVITEPETCHICYCHSPMRFVWRFHDYVKNENINPILKAILPFFINYLRVHDYVSAQQVDYFVANSNTVKNRIKKFYGMDSTVIFPPVATKQFKVSNNTKNYFLIVSRLNAYKRIDIAIKACNKLNIPLKIVGSGPYRKDLEKISGKSIEFLGSVSNNDLVTLYSEAKALIFPGEEDFGIVSVEAQASGRPVIAYGKGGALDTIAENITGVYFNDPTANSLIDAIERFESISFDPQQIVAHAKKFDEDIFKKTLNSFIKEKKYYHDKKFRFRSSNT